MCPNKLIYIFFNELYITIKNFSSNNKLQWEFNHRSSINLFKPLVTYFPFHSVLHIWPLKINRVLWIHNVSSGEASLAPKCFVCDPHCRLRWYVFVPTLLRPFCFNRFSVVLFCLAYRLRAPFFCWPSGSTISTTLCTLTFE